MGDDFGIREGEVAVALPDQFDAHLYFIGRVRTPWTRREQCPKNARESDAVCTLEIDPRFAAILLGPAFVLGLQHAACTVTQTQ